MWEGLIVIWADRTQNPCFQVSTFLWPNCSHTVPSACQCTHRCQFQIFLDHLHHIFQSCSLVCFSLLYHRQLFLKTNHSTKENIKRFTNKIWSIGVCLSMWVLNVCILEFSKENFKSPRESKTSICLSCWIVITTFVPLFLWPSAACLGLGV